MRICRFDDAQGFLEQTREWLLKDELSNSTMLSVVRLLIQDEHPFDTPSYLASVENEGQIVGCAVYAPPDPLILSDMPAEAVPLLAADMATAYANLPAVTGKATEVDSFAEHWAQQTATPSVSRIHWRWYVLERVRSPLRAVPGALRLASSSDLELVRKWARQFAREIGTSVDVVAFFERRIESDSLYIWDDGAPRSIVAVSGVTPNSIRISGVFTAPELRRKGYASATVASVSRLMLDAGHKFCLLFTEASDPSANRLYRNIGYRPIFDKFSIILSD
ncbi:MAG: GNAT family N-acetyltransferase [Gammaproteobacteria bacterium]|nr:GNAT family N-acetyltransferase [Gammaproteobacteria bacterium]MDH4315237.1 GNAT family N-acetyltransferase [Gammaproteobacteria bacterium]MDH5215017.1 GNAT family N-acetyltransferase [Gammaproteobacteria bacterium]MDH5501822.1 GNAT family N-acetyltransferase [Gammaproteobacteria bacterium]